MTQMIEGTKHLEKLTYLTCKQAAELLQVDAETVRRKNRQGLVPGAKTILGVTRIRTDVLLAAIEADAA
jgi:predicted site-specific integrase-resolvase